LISQNFYYFYEIIWYTMPFRFVPIFVVISRINDIVDNNN